MSAIHFKYFLACLYILLANPARSFAEPMRYYKEVPISKIVVEPIPGGINPDFRAVRISGEVLLGSNPCRARGVKTKLVHRKIGSQIMVTALRDASLAEHRICTMEYNPQYAIVRTNVFYHSQLTGQIMIKNVDKMGNHRNAFDFMEGELP